MLAYGSATVQPQNILISSNYQRRLNYLFTNDPPPHCAASQLHYLLSLYTGHMQTAIEYWQIALLQIWKNALSAQCSHALLTHPSALVWKDEPPEAHCCAVVNLNNVGSLRKYIGGTAAFIAASSGKRCSTCSTERNGTGPR